MNWMSKTAPKSESPTETRCGIIGGISGWLLLLKGRRLGIRCQRWWRCFMESLKEGFIALRWGSTGKRSGIGWCGCGQTDTRQIGRDRHCFERRLDPTNWLNSGSCSNDGRSIACRRCWGRGGRRRRWKRCSWGSEVNGERRHQARSTTVTMMIMPKWKRNEENKSGNQRRPSMTSERQQ